MPHHRGLLLKKRKEPPKSNAKLYIAAGVFVVLAFAGAVFIPGRGSRMPDRYELNPTEAYRKEHRALEKALEENVASAKARGASSKEIEDLKASFQVQINKLPKH
jgi:hypothetical protein